MEALYLCKIDVLQYGDPQLHSGVWDIARWLDSLSDWSYPDTFWLFPISIAKPFVFKDNLLSNKYS
jgi:hypothetical protein